MSPHSNSWNSYFPYETQVFLLLFTSATYRRALSVTYHVWTALMVAGIVLLIISLFSPQWHHGPFSTDSSASVAFFAFFTILQILLYVWLPYALFPLLKDICTSDDIRDLFTEASTCSDHSRFSFHVFCYYLCRANTVLIASGTLAYMILYDTSLPTRVFSVFWFLMYVFPLAMVFAIMTCILEAHRRNAHVFIHDLRSIRREYKDGQLLSIEASCIQPDNPLIKCSMRPSTVDEETGLDMRESSRSDSAVVADVSNNTSHMNSLRMLISRYYALHSACMLTSERRGCHILLLCCIPLVLIMSSIWALYLKFYTLGSIIGLTIVSLLYFIELGLLLASANETGNIVCREITSLLMRVVNSSAINIDEPESVNGFNRISLNPHTINAINTFVGCLNFVKIEIPFFGNFTLRSRTLVAVFGSILGTFIPGLFVYLQK